MSNLKLAMLPDRKPVKVTVNLSAELNVALRSYADLYQKAYGAAESISELIPYILESFLNSDRKFAKSRKVRNLDGKAAEPDRAKAIGR
jgi:hypothetical protein